MFLPFFLFTYLALPFPLLIVSCSPHFEMTSHDSTVYDIQTLLYVCSSTCFVQQQSVSTHYTPLFSSFPCLFIQESFKAESSPLSTIRFSYVDSVWSLWFEMFSMCILWLIRSHHHLEPYSYFRWLTDWIYRLQSVVFCVLPLPLTTTVNSSFNLFSNSAFFSFFFSFSLSSFLVINVRSI